MGSPPFVGTSGWQRPGARTDDAPGEPGHGVGEPALGGDGDGVGGAEAESGIDLDRPLRRGPRGPPTADACAFSTEHAGHLGESGLGGVRRGSADAVHEPAEDVTCGRPEHEQDRDGDEQPDSGVGPARADRDSSGTDEDGERGQSVGAGVMCPSATRAAEPMARPSRMRKTGDGLVAGEPDESRDGHPAEVVDRGRSEERVDGLPPRR